MKFFYCIFFFTLCALQMKAQTMEVKKQMSLGIQTGINVSLPGIEDKFIDKVWKKFTKDYGKLSKNKKAKEEFIEAATIKTISSSIPMDIYTITEDGSMTAFFDIKTGFLNSNDYPKEFGMAMDFMREFGFEVQREKVREELETENDKLKKLNKNLEKLKKDKDDLKNDIVEYKEKIKKAESDIITNERDQEKTKENIEGQIKTVQMVQEKLNKIGKN